MRASSARIHQLVVRDQRHAAQLQRPIEGVRTQAVDQQRAPQLRGDLLCRLQRLGAEGTEQRYQRVAVPQPRHFGSDHGAGVRFAARRGLDLQIQREGVAAQIGGHVAQARQRLAGIGGAVPAAGIEARQFTPPVIAGGAGGVGGAFQRGVVQQEGHAVVAELDVAFEGLVAIGRTQAERRQRVFRRQLAGAAVGDPQRVGPGRHQATRSCVCGSNQCSRSAGTRSGTRWPACGRGKVPSMRAVNSVWPSRQ